MEKKWILESFDKIFGKYKDKRIVLYGTGFRTGIVIDNFNDYNFIGVMDFQKNEEFFCELNVFNDNDIGVVKPDIIIILAQPSSKELIFSRIAMSCLNNNINVMDFHGRDLYSLYNIDKYKMKNIEYYSKSKENMIDEIDKYRHIGVEIKDIFLSQLYMNIEDFYQIVLDRNDNKCMSDIYKNVKNILRKHKYIDIAYKELLINKMTEIEIENILHFEFNIWTNTNIVRDDILDIINYARDRNIEVSMINNTWYSNDYIEKFLKSKKLNLKIIDSNDLNKIENIELIIASNNKEYYKYRTYEIKSTIDMIEMSSYRNLLFYCTTINQRNIICLFGSYVFNSPFALFGTDGTITISNFEKYNNMFIFPIALKFTIWIFEKSSEYDGFLFASRDTFIIKELFDIMNKYFNKDSFNIYFKTSRTACVKCSIDSHKDIQWLLDMPFMGDVKDILKYRFELDDDMIQNYDSQKYFDTTDYIYKHEKLILKKSKQLRDNYIKYIDNLGLKIDKKYAFVDLVSSGTCHYFLNKIMPYKISGLYLGSYITDFSYNKQLNYNSIFSNGYKCYGTNSYLIENYLYLESIFTSKESSLLSFDVNGKCIYDSESRKDSELKNLEIAHNSIILEFTKFLKYLYVRNSEIESNFIDYIYQLKDIPYTRNVFYKDEALFIRDDFGRGFIQL